MPADTWRLFVGRFLPLREILVVSPVLLIFDGMKKAVLHILFWMAYWALLAYFEYLWMRDFIPQWPRQKMLERSLLTSVIYGLPHLLLAYYIAYYALERIVARGKGLLTNLSLVLLPYVAVICLIILLAREWVLPIVYEGIVTPAQGFFDPRKFFSIMIEAAFPGALLVAIRFVHTQLAAKEREKNLVQEKLSTELRLLQGQLNPHFLFNTLNNIYALTRKKSDLAPEVVLKLSELLSFMLYEAGHHAITIEREVKFLEDYISLQRIRYDERLTLRFHKEIDDPGQCIAPLLLLPLVENAFKHGASENHFDSYIHIQLVLKQGWLSFEVENSFEEKQPNGRPQSIGLYNTVRRLELTYREQKMEVSNHQPVFKVQLTANLNSNGKI